VSDAGLVLNMYSDFRFTFRNLGFYDARGGIAVLADPDEDTFFNEREKSGTISDPMWIVKKLNLA